MKTAMHYRALHCSDSNNASFVFTAFLRVHTLLLQEDVSSDDTAGSALVVTTPAPTTTAATAATDATSDAVSLTTIDCDKEDSDVVGKTDKIATGEATVQAAKVMLHT
jgi:hypothetical protein